MASPEESAKTSAATARATAAAHKSGEQRGPSPTPPYQEWASQVQAFYTHAAATATATASASAAYFPASPQPYLWGAQPMIAAYGAPVCSPVYIQGGAYTHPAVTVASGSPYQAADLERNAAKNLQGEDAAAKGKSRDEDEDVDDASPSESEGSSEARGGSSEPQDIVESGKGNLSKRLSDVGGSQLATAPAPSSGTTGESSYNGRGTGKLPVSAPGRVVLPAAATNLNIGMDAWNGAHGEAGNKVQANVVGVAPAMAATPVVGRKGVIPEQQWDERELKRQRRQQSNRESARRSRLRKQQECEDLGRRVDELGNENNALRKELEQLNKDCKELASENKSILEELTQLYGPGVLSTLEGTNGDSTSIQSVDDKPDA